MSFADDIADGLSELRVDAVSRMRDTATVRRPAVDAPIDDDTVVDAPEFEPDPVYEGRCRVKVLGVQPEAADSADSTVTAQTRELHVPDDAPALLPGDVVFMAADTYTPRLRGLVFRVDSDAAGSDMTAQRVPVTLLPGVRS